MYRVLAPVDTDEERAQAQIDTLLDLPSATDELRVDVLYVYEEIDAPGDEAGPAYIDEINRSLKDLQGLPDTVSRVVNSLRESGVEVEAHDVTGDPASAILELADEFDVNAISLSARRRSPVGKVLFGSVTQAVILDSERPVIVAPA
ncbi:universal stress protein [Natrononativus amylolyticus]|uniref:universal stress protein n=1 Tax=Natrononativus amylolyticus TaxID=2963434 RepID=UPI0020CC3F08|nr:universal stress protein [Natrononativus amylolyticus]